MENELPKHYIDFDSISDKAFNELAKAIPKKQRENIFYTSVAITLPAVPDVLYFVRNNWFGK